MVVPIKASVFYKRSKKLVTCIPANNKDSDGSSDSDDNVEKENRPAMAKEGVLVPVSDDEDSDDDDDESERWQTSKARHSSICIPPTPTGSSSSSSSAVPSISDMSSPIGNSQSLQSSLEEKKGQGKETPGMKKNEKKVIALKFQRWPPCKSVFRSQQRSSPLHHKNTKKVPLAAPSRSVGRPPSKYTTKSHKVSKRAKDLVTKAKELHLYEEIHESQRISPEKENSEDQSGSDTSAEKENSSPVKRCGLYSKLNAWNIRSSPKSSEKPVLSNISNMSHSSQTPISLQKQILTASVSESNPKMSSPYDIGQQLPSPGLSTICLVSDHQDAPKMFTPSENRFLNSTQAQTLSSPVHNVEVFRDCFSNEEESSQNSGDIDADESGLCNESDLPLVKLRKTQRKKPYGSSDSDIPQSKQQKVHSPVNNRDPKKQMKTDPHDAATVMFPCSDGIESFSNQKGNDSNESELSSESDMPLVMLKDMQRGKQCGTSGSSGISQSKQIKVHSRAHHSNQLKKPGTTAQPSHFELEQPHAQLSTVSGASKPPVRASSTSPVNQAKTLSDACLSDPHDAATVMFPCSDGIESFSNQKDNDSNESELSSESDMPLVKLKDMQRGKQCGTSGSRGISQSKQIKVHSRAHHSNPLKKSGTTAQPSHFELEQPHAQLPTESGASKPSVCASSTSPMNQAKTLSDEISHLQSKKQELPKNSQITPMSEFEVTRSRKHTSTIPKSRRKLIFSKESSSLPKSNNLVQSASPKNDSSHQRFMVSSQGQTKTPSEEIPSVNIGTDTSPQDIQYLHNDTRREEISNDTHDPESLTDIEDIPLAIRVKEIMDLARTRRKGGTSVKPRETGVSAVDCSAGNLVLEKAQRRSNRASGKGQKKAYESPVIFSESLIVNNNEEEQRLEDLPEDNADENTVAEDDNAWKDGDLQTPPPAVQPNFTIPSKPKEPVEYFQYFFDEDTIKLIVEQSNLYSAQKDKPSNFTSKDIECFLGVTIYMGICALPCIEDYWSGDLRVPQVADVMSRKLFTKLRSHIHFVDNNNLTPDEDRLRKIRPLLNVVRKKCQNIEYEYALSVDETMVPYKGTFAGNIRQYMPDKPSAKWGFKIFVLAGRSGLVYDFIPYCGPLTFANEDLTADEERMGMGGKAVISLCKSIKQRDNTTVTFDNFYTGIPLLTYLKREMNLLSLGTVRKNRTGGCPLLDDKALMKKGRGSYDSKVNNKGVTIIKWADNKTVCLASTQVGIQPLGTVLRYDKTEKRKIQVPCPRAVLEYNANMGGVDLCDMDMSLYRCHSRARRWYYPLFCYMLDLALTNAYLLYKRDCTLLNVKPVFKNSKEFRIRIFQSLTAPSQRSRGRPTLNNSLSKQRINRPIIPRPVDEIRLHKFEHFPLKTGKGRCRYCKSGYSRIKCSKCEVLLCLFSDKNCFVQFHLQA